MVAIGLSGGGLAYAASSGGAPTLTLAHAPAVKVVPGKPGGPILVPVGGPCPRLSLSPVHGKAPKLTPVHGKAPKLTPVHGKAPKVTRAELPVRVHARAAIVCSRGITSGGPVLLPAGGGCSGLSLSPVHGVKAPKFTKAEARVRVHARPIACSAGKTSGR